MIAPSPAFFAALPRLPFDAGGACGLLGEFAPGFLHLRCPPRTAAA
jgi:hypothetical protein